MFSHSWGLWEGSGVICGDSTVPRCWHSLHLLGSEGGIAPWLDYLPACVPSKMFSEDTLKNPPLQGLLIGSELSFINGTDYMQVYFFSHPIIINGYWIKRLIWPVWCSMSAWKRNRFPSSNCRGWKRKTAVHTARESPGFLEYADPVRHAQ